MEWWLWAVLGLLLLVLETHLTRDFSLFCFGVGAWIVAALSGFAIIETRWLQWLVFSASSLALLFFARAWLQQLLAPGWDDEKEVDNLIGEVAIPLNDLTPDGFGKAELRGSQWSARNVAKTPIANGQRCRVARVDGLTLWIAPE